MKIQNLEVWNQWGRKFGVRWTDADGIRYHFWFYNPATIEPEDGTLYKNPPIDVRMHDARHFNTRHLVASNKVNQPVIAEVQRLVRDGNLIQRAIDEAADAERKRLDGAHAAWRQSHIESCGPQLLTALKGLVTYVELTGGYAPDDAPGEVLQAKAAIAEAEIDPETAVERQTAPA